MRFEIEQRGQKLDSFKEIVEKAVDAKAKTTFRPCSYVWNTD